MRVVMSVDRAEKKASMFREVKAAKNQSLFREVNEQLKELGAHSKSFADDQGAICECADEACSDRISLTAGEYQDLRERGTWFAVAPGREHVFADVEKIVEKTESFWIVEKTNHAGALAEKLDPRPRREGAQS
jgi:pyridoxine 5'-phosphate synthase PdxJ